MPSKPLPRCLPQAERLADNGPRATGLVQRVAVTTLPITGHASWCREPLTPGKGNSLETAGAGQDRRPRGFPGVVTQCACWPGDYTPFLWVNKGPALCRVLEGGCARTQAAPPAGGWTRGAQSRPSPQPGNGRDWGAGSVGFLMGPFLRSGSTRWESSRSERSRKPCSPVSPRAGFCTDHQGQGFKRR